MLVAAILLALEIGQFTVADTEDEHNLLPSTEILAVAVLELF